MNKSISKNLANENKALLFAEKYGVIEYNVKSNNMIYYVSYPMEHNTYKCLVDLNTLTETRTAMKRYYKRGLYNN